MAAALLDDDKLATTWRDELPDILLARVQARDDRAWVHLIARYEARVAAFVRRFLNGHPEIDTNDVVQNVFLGAFVSLGGNAQFQRRSSFTTWLLSIARHKCLGALSERQFFALDSDAPQEDSKMMEKSSSGRALPEQPSPDDVVLADEVIQVVRAAVKRLSEKKQQMLLMWAEGSPLNEIAERFGLKYITVKSELYRARNELRGELRPYVGDGSLEQLKQVWLAGCDR